MRAVPIIFAMLTACGSSWTSLDESIIPNPQGRHWLDCDGDGFGDPASTWECKPLNQADVNGQGCTYVQNPFDCDDAYEDSGGDTTFMGCMESFDWMFDRALQQSNYLVGVDGDVEYLVFNRPIGRLEARGICDDWAFGIGEVPEWAGGDPLSETTIGGVATLQGDARIRARNVVDQYLAGPESSVTLWVGARFDQGRLVWDHRFDANGAPVPVEGLPFCDGGGDLSLGDFVAIPEGSEVVWDGGFTYTSALDFLSDTFLLAVTYSEVGAECLALPDPRCANDADILPEPLPPAVCPEYGVLCERALQAPRSFDYMATPEVCSNE